MGKRSCGFLTEGQVVTPEMTASPNRNTKKRSNRNNLDAAIARKRLRFNAASNNNSWHTNVNEENSLSNDTTLFRQTLDANQSLKQADNSSFVLYNNSTTPQTIKATNVSPKPVYTLRPSLVNGTVLRDLTQKLWRLGNPIGKGNFGEIFLASDNIAVPVTNENAKYVVKIEPHSNGPLFVEIHCLMNTTKSNIDPVDHKRLELKKSWDSLSSSPSPSSRPSGIPPYIASGSHYFSGVRYRFLVLQRYDCDLYSLIKNCCVSQRCVLLLAIQIIDVLEELHDKGYCHNDVKAQNLMISKCKYNEKMHDGNGGESTIQYETNDEEKQQTTDSGNSSEQEELRDLDDVICPVKGAQHHPSNKGFHNDSDDDYDEDFDDGTTSNSNNSNSNNMYMHDDPFNRNRKRRGGGGGGSDVDYGSCNPVRACRLRQRNVTSHNLRPAKRISYSEFFNEDTSSDNGTQAACSIYSQNAVDLTSSTPVRRFSLNRKPTFTSSDQRQTRRNLHQSKGSLATPTKHISQHYTITGENGILPKFMAAEEERIFLIDFGLASKYIDHGVHRPFVMDQRRAHDGTLEFTSRDAHMGAHSRRSDLECLGYNLIFWSQGYLPWREAASQQQQENVHRAKEYLMTDVREMLKQIYGKQVPKFLGEFLHHVGQLAYCERPDYALYRRIFECEYQKLGYHLIKMRLDSQEITMECERFKEEIENKFDLSAMNTTPLYIARNMPVGVTPFRERTTTNRVSPKNLRSKSQKKNTKRKKFCWAEILSQDPDQIARERAEKEFGREAEVSDGQHNTSRQYDGKPTYAILEVLRRMKFQGRVTMDGTSDEEETEEQ